MKRFLRINLKGISLPQIIIELIIVFCGVYLAFYLSDREDEKKINQQSYKILKSLKIELEQMRIFFPDQSEYMEGKIDEWVELYQEEQWGDYYTWRYLQPQNNYAVLEYALNERETEILDFDLYKELMQLYRNILQLEESERYMTELGYMYHPRVQDPGTDPQLNRLREENLFHFYKFINAANDRANSLQRVADLSASCLELIEAKFTRQENIEMTRELFQLFIDSKNNSFSREELIPLFKEAFPTYTEEELDYVIKNLNFG